MPNDPSPATVERPTHDAFWSAKHQRFVTEYIDGKWMPIAAIAAMEEAAPADAAYAHKFVEWNGDSGFRDVHNVMIPVCAFDGQLEAAHHPPEPLAAPVDESESVTTAAKLGALYDDALVIARATAREHGYALAIHGSQIRDLDLIAMPWVEEASPPEVLAEAIRAALGAVFSVGTQTGEVMTVQPHGRLSWAIHLKAPWELREALAASPRHFAPYIDLSVMPTNAEAREKRLRDALEALEAVLAPFERAAVAVAESNFGDNDKLLIQWPAHSIAGREWRALVGALATLREAPRA